MSWSWIGSSPSIFTINQTKEQTQLVIPQEFSRIWRNNWIRTHSNLTCLIEIEIKFRREKSSTSYQTPTPRKVVATWAWKHNLCNKQFRSLIDTETPTTLSSLDPASCSPPPISKWAHKQVLAIKTRCSRNKIKVYNILIKTHNLKKQSLCIWGPSRPHHL